MRVHNVDVPPTDQPCDTRHIDGELEDVPEDGERRGGTPEDQMLAAREGSHFGT